MADAKMVTARSATSWGAVLGGWLATIGASVVFAGPVAGLVAAGAAGNTDLALAVPVVLGILLSYVVGGYVAGKMAAYRTSWHGMMTAFFTLFILLAILLVGGLADQGVFAPAGVNSLKDVVPAIANVDTRPLDTALSFAAILGFLAAIFGGWLGGLLAPSLAAPVAPTAVTKVTSPDRPRGTLIPAFGRKGGERMSDGVDDVHTSRAERA